MYFQRKCFNNNVLHIRFVKVNNLVYVRYFKHKADILENKNKEITLHAEFHLDSRLILEFYVVQRKCNTSN